eukprot:10462858-Lingulodinium_polyedra.AAC.1
MRQPAAGAATRSAASSLVPWHGAAACSGWQQHLADGACSEAAMNGGPESAATAHHSMLEGRLE